MACQAALSGFRYLLALENGEPADPGAFVTNDPEWRPSDAFVAGGQLFKVLAVEAEVQADESPVRMGLLVVEPVGALRAFLAEEQKVTPLGPGSTEPAA